MVREQVQCDATWYAWRFRLDHTSENDERVEEWCYLYGDRWIISKEHGSKEGNAHYQGALLSTHSKFILHQYIKSDLSLFDRDFSCKPCRKPETYFSYLTKEEILVWYCDSKLLEVKAWVEMKKPIKEEKDTFMNRMIRDFQAATDDETEGDILPISIYNWVCEYFIKHTKIHDRFIIDRHANVLVGIHASEYRRHQVHKWGTEWAFLSGFKRVHLDIHDPYAIQAQPY